MDNLIRLQRRIKAKCAMNHVHMLYPETFPIYHNLMTHRREQKVMEERGEEVGIFSLINKQETHLLDSLCDSIEITSILLQHYSTSVLPILFPSVKFIIDMQKRNKFSSSLPNLPSTNSHSPFPTPVQSPALNITEIDIEQDIIEVLDHDVVVVPLTTEEQIEFDQTYPPMTPPHEVYLGGDGSRDGNGSGNNNGGLNHDWNHNQAGSNTYGQKRTPVNVITIQNNPYFVHYVHSGLWYKFYLVLNRLAVVNDDVDFFLTIHPFITTQQFTGLISFPINIQHITNKQYSVRGTTRSDDKNAKSNSMTLSSSSNLHIKHLQQLDSIYSHRPFHRKSLRTGEQMLLQLLGLFVRIFFHTQLTLHFQQSLLQKDTYNTPNLTPSPHGDFHPQSVNNTTFLNSTMTNQPGNGHFQHLNQTEQRRNGGNEFDNNTFLTTIYYHYLGLYNHLFGSDISTIWHMNPMYYIFTVINSLSELVQTRQKNTTRLELIKKKYLKNPQLYYERRRKLIQKDNLNSSNPNYNNPNHFNPQDIHNNNPFEQPFSPYDPYQTHPALWNINPHPKLNESILKSDFDHLSLWFTTLTLSTTSNSDENLFNSTQHNHTQNISSPISKPHFEQPQPPIVDYFISKYPPSILSALFPGYIAPTVARQSELAQNVSLSPFETAYVTHPNDRFQYHRSNLRQQQRDAEIKLKDETDSWLMNTQSKGFSTLEFVSALYNSPLPILIDINSIGIDSDGINRGNPHGNPNNTIITAKQWNQHFEKVQFLVHYYTTYCGLGQ
jgi:hypothetical protein